MHIKALWPYLFINGIFNFDDYNVSNWAPDTTNSEIMRHNFFCKFLPHKDSNVDKRIICTSYCRVRNQTVIATGNIAIITENEAELEQIKLIQESYDLCEENMKIWKHKKLNFQNKSTQTDFRLKLVHLL